MPEDDLTADERTKFLKRQSWENANAEDRAAMGATWTDAKIRMAIDLNLA